MKTFCLVIGWILTVAAAILWFGSMGAIWAKDGFWAMLNLMSPFNIWQWAMTILLFLPGGLALHYGKK